MSLTFWTGPANLSQVGPTAVIPGTEAAAIPCVGGYGEPLCRDLAWSWRDAQGRRLPGLFARLGLGDGVGDVFLCAFSAGGSLIRALASNPTDREMVRLTYFADATYSDGWAGDRPILTPELLELAEATISSPRRLMVCTAGESPNYGKPSAAQVLDELRRVLEEKYGPFDPEPVFDGLEPAPVWSARKGNLVLARYGLQPLVHAGHATELAGRVIPALVVPWYQAGMGLPTSGGAPPGTMPPGTLPPGGSPTIEPGRTEWWKVGLLGIAVATALVIYKILGHHE